jgi:hypothetical protein
MGHERSAGGGRGDRGRSDEPDDFGGPDDETVVIVSDRYTRAALLRLADSLRECAALCDEFREGGEAAPGAEAVAVLGELAERLSTLPLIADGTYRAVARLHAEEVERLRRERPDLG